MFPFQKSRYLTERRQMEMLISTFFKASLFLFTFLFVFFLHKRFVENNVWGKVVKKYKDNVEKSTN